MFFPKTQQCIAQIRNRTENQQSCSCQLGISYLLRCIVAVVGILTVSAFLKHNTTVSEYVYCGPHTNNFLITTLCSNKLSCATANNVL